MPEPLPEPQVRVDIQRLVDYLLINLSQEGRSIDLVMTPAGAIDLGKQLIKGANMEPRDIEP